MNGVAFGDFHTYEDFDLILSSKTVETPEVKSEKVDLPGGDGEIDLTDYFGEPKYKNRTLEFNFSTVAPMTEFLERFSDLNNKIHGKKLHVTLDEDSGFYYVGRCSVSAWKSNGRVGEITVKCDCEPYKYKTDETTKADTITTSGTVVYSNLRKQVVPKFTTTAGISLAFGTKTFVIESAGTYTFPDLVFAAGNNSIAYTGTATVTVVYQEGAL